MLSFFFYLFAGLSVSSAIGVLVLRNPIHSAMSLVATFFCLGGIYIILNSEFVAVIQVLVYAGAIMVLFLFVLMLLTSLDREEKDIFFTFPKIVALGVTLGILTQICSLFLSNRLRFGPKDVYTAQAISEEGSIRLIGRLLFTDYVLPFEVISILLLVAVIGAVVIAKKRHVQ